MSSADADPQPWQPRRWWVLCFIVFFGQLAIIFWLGDKDPVLPRPARPAPELGLITEGREELLSLLDPTLFALPSERGFAGLVWLRNTNPALQPFDWSEPFRWLPPGTNHLGALPAPSTPLEVLSTYRSAPMPDPELLLPEASPPPMVLTRSVLRLEGEPPAPALESAIVLPSWPPRSSGGAEADMLTNSIVQLTLNRQGQTVSATLLSGSGSQAADDYALAQARSARFTPASVEESSEPVAALAALRWCRMIFQWHTEPATNAPAKSS